METIAYVDGYNLYYGRLRNTRYKWIDVFSLVEKICFIHNPHSRLAQLKYFTAPVKASFSSHGQESLRSQSNYHNALKTIRGDSIEIIKGFHSVRKGTPPLYQKPIKKSETVEIWRFEEKQTDVNIAIHMYRDAVLKKCRQQVLISNDSDLESVLKYIKKDVSEVCIGLIIPNRILSDSHTSRAVTGYLDQYSDWTRKYILDDECSGSLMPKVIVREKRKPIIKPDYW